MTDEQGIVFRGPGAPLVPEPLRLDPPGPGEVRVRIVASGVCRSDLHVVDGDWERPAGVVLGHEGAGIVEALGPGVPERPADRPAGSGGLRTGDLVVLAWTAPCATCPACRRLEPWLCATPRGGTHRTEPELVRLRRPDGSPVGVYSGVGTHATAQVVDAAAAIAVDPRTPHDVAALIGCAATTGVGAVRWTAGVRAGERVAILGMGGVGLSALLAAIAAGAEVTAVDPVPEKRARARALGAVDAVDPGDDAHLARLGRPFDHVLECIGLASAVEGALRLVRPGGTVTVVGMPPQGVTAAVELYSFVVDGIRLLGSNYGSLVPERDLPEIAADVVTGRLPLGRLIDAHLPLAALPDALAAMRRGEGARRILLPGG